jgi:hypothetical protein
LHKALFESVFAWWPYLLTGIAVEDRFVAVGVEHQYRWVTALNAQVLNGRFVKALAICWMAWGWNDASGANSFHFFHARSGCAALAGGLRGRRFRRGRLHYLWVCRKITS